MIKMLTIAVCDDEITECYNLSLKIRGILKEMKVSCVVRQFNSAVKLLEATEDFDIIFLDILMKGTDGLKAAKLFRKKAFDKLLIFVSSSRDYVFEAYDVEAFHYLVKPVEEKKLQNILERAVLKTEKQFRDFIMISRERQQKKLFLNDIYYFEIIGRVIYVHKAKEVLDFYEQIGVLEKNLSGKGFCRCHKSYLVNLKYVDGYTRQEILLENGEKIAVSKRRYDEFCRELMDYMKRNGGMG